MNLAITYYLFVIIDEGEVKMWIAIAILAVIIIAFLFEYRIRKPDEIVVYESAGIMRKRKRRLYPRHFSLAISGTIHSTELKVEAEAKGKILLHVHVVATVAASIHHLQNLVRAGGWRKDNMKSRVCQLKHCLPTFRKKSETQLKIWVWILFH
jgi:hypothetical protein